MCVHVCIYGCECACVYVCVHVCIYEYECACVYVCVCMCVYMGVSVCTYVMCARVCTYPPLTGTETPELLFPRQD